MTLASGEIMGQIFHIAFLGFELHLRLLPSHDALCSGWVKAEGRVSAKEHEVGASPGSQLSGQGTMARGPHCFACLDRGPRATLLCLLDHGHGR